MQYAFPGPRLLVSFDHFEKVNESKQATVIFKTGRWGRRLGTPEPFLNSLEADQRSVEDQQRKWLLLHSTGK